MISIRSRIIRTIGFLFLASLLATGQVRAQDSLQVIGSVNDDVITLLDVIERIVLLLRTSGIEDTAANRQQVYPDALDMLVNERLQLQEAERVGLRDGQSALEDARRAVARNIGVSVGQLDNRLVSMGINPESLNEKLLAEQLWVSLVSIRLRRTPVTEDNVDDELDRLIAEANQPVVLLSEIFLKSDSSESEDGVIGSLREIGKSISSNRQFAQIAQQYSQSASARLGGDLGWINESELPPATLEAIQSLEVGGITPPVRTNDGFAIFLLRNRGERHSPRPDDDVVQVRQLTFGGGNVSDEQIAAITSGITGCDSLEDIVESQGTLDVGSPIEARMGDLDPSIRTLLDPLKEGEVSAPYTAGEVPAVLVVCSRTVAGLPTRDEVFQTLQMQRFERIARSYMRELHRNAFIDIKR